MTEQERFWAKVKKTDSCWVWAKHRNANGYGQFHVKRHPTLAHRYAFAQARGPIPRGLSVLHRCDTPACVNPSHLFLGTQSDNLKDMVAKGRGRHPLGDAMRSKTQCKHGHEFTPENTGLTQQANGMDRRYCKCCKVRQQRKFRSMMRDTMRMV